jgi:hypothetical protein
VLLALLGATAGQGVVYTGQFYALFFLLITLKLDFSREDIARKSPAGAG